MQPATILLPLFVQVTLTLFLLVRSGLMRRAAIVSGRVRMKDIALGQPVWPEDVQKASNAFSNQMQLPVLFHLLLILVLVTRQADFFLLALAWLFVVSRLVHAWIHSTSNYVPNRFRAFLAGFIILALMWLWFAGKIISAGM